MYKDFISGLGCPSALYLAGAGVGRLGLVDHDTVELSNLHRQVAHTQARLQVNKAVSLATSCTSLNTEVDVVPYKVVFDSSNALDIIKEYDLVLDCTDNVATRYLLNDACVISGKPLVSGSALRWEGQLTVFNYNNGPTYRCLYPSPPSPDTVTNCSDGGVVGPVVGVIGSLQALETVKILSGAGTSYSGVMMMFDALEGRVRNIKLRGRGEVDVTGLVDYVQFCGAAATDKDTGVKILGSEDRITVQELQQIRDESSSSSVLVDVRSKTETEICCLERSVNIPLSELQYDGNHQSVRERLSADQEDESRAVYVICKRGNDSQTATGILRKILPGTTVKDVIGGLHAWAKHIDHQFPVY